MWHESEWWIYEIVLHDETSESSQVWKESKINLLVEMLSFYSDFFGQVNVD